MDKQQAINLLKTEDIETIMKDIKNRSLKVVYWKSGADMDDELNLWFIDNESISDFLYFYSNINLHWTVLVNDLIERIKKEIDYKEE